MCSVTAITSHIFSAINQDVSTVLSLCDRDRITVGKVLN
jgi:hypothetical protein